jgi:predicted nucleic acid-binding protein
MKGGFLLDTNIPSELMRPRPEPRVKDWIETQDVSISERSVYRRIGRGPCNDAG